MEHFWGIYVFLSLLTAFDCNRRLNKANKEIERLRGELTKQINENLKFQNNFSTDPVK